VYEGIFLKPYFDTYEFCDFYPLSYRFQIIFAVRTTNFFKKKIRRTTRLPFSYIITLFSPLQVVVGVFESFDFETFREYYRSGSRVGVPGRDRDSRTLAPTTTYT
jgi:hypothetical protein